MIKNYWYAILRVGKVGKKPLRIQRLGENLVLWKDSKGNLICFQDRCPHRGTALSLGRVVEGTLECPFHGFRYNTKGQCVDIPIEPKKSGCPAFLQVKRFQIREAKGLVWLWWGEPRESYPDLPWFEELSDPNQPYVELDRVSPIHFGRFMEANLDFAHFYFVHKFMRMPGMGPLADSFVCHVNGDLLKISGVLRQENTRGVRFDGALLFPALAQYDTPGRKEEKNRSLVAACPVGEGASWFTYRIYLKPGFALGLRKAFWKWFFLKLIFPIVHQQDLTLISKQQPNDFGIHSDQLVTHADQGIIQYFRLWKRASMLEKAEYAEEKRRDEAILN